MSPSMFFMEYLSRERDMEESDIYIMTSYNCDKLNYQYSK